MRNRVMSVLIGAALFAGSANADEQPATTDCAAIESAEERLACYDAEAKTDPVASPQEEDFGLAKPKSETEGESLTGQIVGVWKDAYRKLIIELDNGQVWRQIETKRFDAAVGDIIVIRHGSLGSYKLYVEGGQGWIRVRREE